MLKVDNIVPLWRVVISNSIYVQLGATRWQGGLHNPSRHVRRGQKLGLDGVG